MSDEDPQVGDRVRMTPQASLMLSIGFGVDQQAQHHIVSPAAYTTQHA